MPTRHEMWEKLGGTVDVLVVGGGITGAGIARDAARRGLSVALVEMRDLAFGTSSRSSKLVHGGLRYLEMGELSLVFEAVSERRILMDIAPHIVNPLGFLFPVFKTSRRSRWFINAGMWVYDGLSLFRSPKLHKNLDAAGVAHEEPSLTQEGLTGAPLYYDCSTDDARLTLETALDAAKAGATIATWAKVVSFTKDDNGRVKGAVVEDAFGGGLKQITARTVVNATGPWTDKILAMSRPSTSHLLRPTKGVHIVVDAAKLPLNNAVVCLHPKDGRLLFAIPWGDRTYIGTTDTDYTGDPADVAASGADVRYLIDACAAYFPKNPLGPRDVISTWAGLRPLIAPQESPGGVSESAVSREHSILVGQDGLITIAGGKLTTYRRMAAEVVDTAVKLLRLSNQLPKSVTDARTDQEPLPGAVGWPADDNPTALASQVIEASGGRLAADTADYLTNRYGALAIDIARSVAQNADLGARLVEGRPEILAQVDWAVHRELAATAADIFVRRTQLYFRDHDQGLAALPAVVARMATLLDWSDERRQHETADYNDEVARSRRWRAEYPAG
jgi:glycerol-3-phosphate dehydrogenase